MSIFFWPADFQLDDMRECCRLKVNVVETMEHFIAITFWNYFLQVFFAIISKYLQVFASIFASIFCKFFFARFFLGQMTFS